MTCGTYDLEDSFDLMEMGCLRSCQKQTEGNDLHWAVCIISGA